jgi:hypothetical protein
MYFEELSKYRYNFSSELEGVLNVGWLDSSHDFKKGPVLSEIIVKLRALAVTKTVNQARGFHYCEFCQKYELKKLKSEADQNGKMDA